MRRLKRRGHLVLRLAPGMELERVATNRDVRMGAAMPSTALDGGGALDQVIKSYSPGMLVTRAFYAKSALATTGRGHLGFDHTEHALGLSRTFRVQIDPDTHVESVAQELTDTYGVEMAAPQYLVEAPYERPELDTPSIDAARAMIGAQQALEMEPGDTALIVGLVDSGVDMQHPELHDRLRPGITSVALPKSDDPDLAIISGYRARREDVDDEAGHGTFCAAIICANGYRIPRGLAGAARLLPIRSLCQARVRGETRLTVVGAIEDINSGWKTAIDLGARILNLSFGTAEDILGPDDPIPHTELVQYALARDCILVAASGNAGTTVRVYPAALPGVIAVGAVAPNGTPSHFSSRGDHVALSAPGERLLSAGLDGRYVVSSGTSFAAPLVASACALLVARGARNSVPLTPAEVRAHLVSSSKPFASGVEANGCGAGILDVPASLRALDAAMHEEAA